MQHYSEAEHVNVGSGEDISILELTRLVCDVVGLDAEIGHDLTKPDGTPRKLMDGSLLASLGWRPSTSLADGLALSYEWFLNHVGTEEIRA